MANNKVHCRICKELINKVESNDWIMPSRNYYYHKTCYNDWQTKKDDVHTNITDEELWKDATWKYFERTLLIPMNFLKFSNQWKSLIKKGRTPKGIYFTTRYFYEIEKGDKTKAQGGIGIIDYIYNRSCQYWASREKNGEQILSKIEAQVKADLARETIKIKQEKKNKKRNKYKHMINFGEIEETANDR